MLLVKGLRSLEVLVLEEPLVDREGLRAQPAADRVVEGVSDDGGHGQQPEEEGDVEVLGLDRRHRPGGEQERIAGKERHYDEACFAEDDREQEDVGPRAPGLENAVQHFVELEEDVEDRARGVHHGLR